MALDIMSGGSILVGVLIAAGTYFNWPKKLSYLWALLVLLLGILGATGIF